MTLLQSLSLLIVFAAFVSYTNYRWLKLPPAIGMVVVSTGVAVFLALFGNKINLPIEEIKPVIKQFDFHDFLIHGVLAFLLFAGATKVDVSAIKKWAGPIISLASVGVFISALVTGLFLWGAALILGVDLPFIWAFLFGALIAPTDPIAALGIVRSINAPKDLETKMVGESLFNDGTGVVLFLTLMAIIQGIDQTFTGVSIMLVRELLGAVILGLLMGGIVYLALRSVDEYSVVVLLTLALATSSYALAEYLHVSAPICTVVAGLFIGNKINKNLSEHTKEHVDQFWEFIDQMLNASLFALMGLELLIIEFAWDHVILGFIAFVCTLFGRFAGVFIPLLPFGKKINKGTVPVLTMGGLRGGISLALALSIAAGPEAGIIATITFVTVMLSALVQGLSLKYVVVHYNKPDVDIVGPMQEESEKF